MQKSAPGFCRFQTPRSSSSFPQWLRPVRWLLAVAGLSGASFSQTHTHTEAGRLARTTYADGRWVAYTYDASGNLQRVTTSETPVITATPNSVSPSIGSSIAFPVTASGPALTYQWRRNGKVIPGETSGTLSIAAVQPSHAGLYTLTVTNASGSVESAPIQLAPRSDQKLAGTGDSLPEWQDIRHPNGNFYDQVLLTGPAVTVRADPGQVTRVSFIDTNDDIVQVEFSGEGSLTVMLENASGPLPPALYNQSVGYMKGQPTLILAGATEATYLSVFSVGRSNAVIPYPRLLELGYGAAQLAAANIVTGVVPTDRVPAALGGNGTETFASRNQASALFQAAANYDGIADVRALAVQSPSSKLGGIFGGNVRFGAREGPTGIHAPGVAVAVRVVLHDLQAESDGLPLLQLGSCPATLIAGGSLRQPNARPLLVDGLIELQMVAGSNAHGTVGTAKACRARFEQLGVDVTSRLKVIGP